MYCSFIKFDFSSSTLDAYPSSLLEIDFKLKRDSFQPGIVTIQYVCQIVNENKIFGLPWNYALKQTDKLTSYKLKHFRYHASYTASSAAPISTNAILWYLVAQNKVFLT